MLEVLNRIETELGTRPRLDPEFEKMQEPTHVRQLADQMEQIEREVDERAARGPHSAADTEA